MLAISTMAPPEVRAEVFPRIAAAEGVVVAHKSGEEAQFVDVANWRPVDVNQDLLAGDTLRTNAAGNLTIRFSDKTLVRMGRNTTMLVKKISAVTDSVLGLQEGSIWARAARGGSQLQIDTPAAAAAIRGTDWTLRVSGAQTTLTVLEGAVELSNKQGSVLVKQGEGATVTIGQAPRKYTLVNLKEREQILLYNELRDVFTDMSPSGLNGPRARAERRRILAAKAPARSADDWLLLAETSLSLTGRQEAQAALSHLKRPLRGANEARAKLVEAMLAGQELQYAKAAQLFAAALPGLPHDRKATAAYGLWFARSLAEPNRAFPPPSEGTYGDDPAAALARAQAVAHLQGQAEAIKVLAAAEKRFPDDARLPAARAALALELDRRDEVKEALARARAIDPDDPDALLTSAQFRETVSSDVDGALAELQHAAAIAPGISAVWNEIAIVQSDRNAIVEADHAHKRANALNPENPALHANYARFLMDNDQVEAAKREIDAAEAIDPQAYPVLAAKGRYLLRIGKTAEGEKALLDASAVNPTYGDALIGLAIASYQQNDPDETAQALDNADRFDPLNPSISLIRSGIAIDQYQADQAIVEAREALRRRQLRGGYYSGYDTNRQASSFLGTSLENLGLDEWGHYYEDRAYDPFKSTTYLDEANAGRLSPFVGVPISGLARFPEGLSSASSKIQAELLDPLGIASESRRNSLEQRTFFEGTLSGDIIDQGAGPGWGGSVLLQGTSYKGIPVSYSVQQDMTRPKSELENDETDSQGLNVEIGAHPTLQDRFVFFGSQYDQNQGFPGQITLPSPYDELHFKNTTIGGAWSHTIEDRNIVQVFAVSNDSESFLQSRTIKGKKQTDQTFHDQTSTFGLSHILGIGPVTVRYGVEASQLDSQSSMVKTWLATGQIIKSSSFSDDTFATRSYVDATLDVSRDLRLEAGAHMVRFDGASSYWGPVDPRLGIAWSFAEGQWLRAYWRQDTESISGYTLSPISTVGLAPLELSLFSGGQTRTSALRWDAEWTDRFFTSVEYQHQQFTGLFLPYEDLLSSFFTSDGQVDRLNISGNYWIGGGLGSFASLTLNHSEDQTLGFEGYAVPLVPDYVAQIGLKYVHPSRVTAVIAQNFVGRRVGGQDWNEGPIVAKLDPYKTTDAAITWTSLSRSVDVSLSVTNIFDADVESAFDMPAPGRTIRVSLTARY